jgi:proton-dependent oligopeptide transporter, POT family
MKVRDLEAFRASAATDILAGPPTCARGWLGYPYGAWLITGVEFWERFSFYGMLAILPLFLTDSPTHGGFGWSAAEALALVGLYSGSMYAFPAVGGYFADRVIGRRLAVAIGASFMLLGQVLMTSPTFLPAMLGAWYRVPLLDVLDGLGVPLGQISRSETVTAAIAAHGPSVDAHLGTMWLGHAYIAGAVGFYAALACLIVGNALMKSTLVVLCGETFAPDDPRREGAYAYYYLGISAGALLSGVIVGVVAESYGWHYGFGVAAVGMLVALALYLALAPRWLRHIGLRPSRESSRAGINLAPLRAARATGQVGLRIRLVLVMAILLCVFSVGWFQLFGSWSLYIERAVDRSVGRFIIPVPWFSSIDAAVVILAAPAVSALWVHLAARDRSVDIVRKYAFALAMVTLGHVLMCISAVSAASGTPSAAWIPILSVALLGFGEIVAWTATYGFVSRAAPAGFASVTMGTWYLLTLGLGGYLSGFTGHWVDTEGFTLTFARVAVAMGVATAVALFLRRPLLRVAVRAGVDM